MYFKEEKVRLNQIDPQDHTYCISTEKSNDALVNSIKLIGLLHPPMLIKRKSSYSIVSGFRRISALDALNFMDINAWIINEPDEKLEIIKIAISENSMQRPLNIVEKARSLKLLSTCMDNEDALIDVAASAGVACDREWLFKLLKVCDLQDRVLEGLIHGYISLPVALDLDNFDQQTISRFVEVFTILQLSLNRQRELISLVTEISRRDMTSPDQIMGDGYFMEVLHDEALDGKEKAKKILTYLKQIRFPEISKAEERFARNAKYLKLGKGIKLIPPSNFEGVDYTFQLSFKNVKEAEARKSHLDRITKLPEFIKIFDR